MILQKQELYLFEQHSESSKIWSAVIRINTEGKSLIMKSSHDLILVYVIVLADQGYSHVTTFLPLF